ncbi:MAG: metal-dependent hydrolase [Chloroflexi bacterium]|nr:metal-dependent hydrolase [Chloroflexota bacterium]MBP8059740.1 metal-dependent hydrolase [Chloroflexota bacterium]
MNGRNHTLLGGITTFSYLLVTGQTPYQVGLLPFGISMIIGLAAALLPDIDTPNNHLRSSLGVGSRQTSRALRNWRRQSVLFSTWDTARWLVARLLDIVAWILPHRGVTHWLISAGFITVAVAAFCRTQNLPDLFWETFGIGYLSHILADVCTESGVKLFAPFYSRSVTIPFLRVTTGTWTEQIFVYFLVFLWLIWLSYTYLIH